MAKVATKPAAATSFIPMASPSFNKGLLKTLVMTATKQNAPDRVKAIPPTTSIPSVTGVIPLITVIPTNCWIAPITNPKIAAATTPFPKIVNPLIIPFGANHRPIMINTAKITIGIKLTKIIPIGIPAASPPAKHPIGIVTIPLNTPVAKNC